MRASAAVQEDHFNRGQHTNWQKPTTVQLPVQACNRGKKSSERASQCSFLSSFPPFPLVLHQLSSADLSTLLSITASHPLFSPSHLSSPCCSSHFLLPSSSVRRPFFSSSFPPSVYPPSNSCPLHLQINASIHSSIFL